MLRSGYVLGAATRDQEQAARERLSTAMRHHDLRAVLRAAGPTDCRDRATVDRLIPLVRGSPVPDGEFALLESSLDADAWRADVEAARPVVQRLAAGQTTTVVFLAADLDGIALEKVVAGRFGELVAEDGIPWEWDWAELAPCLAADPDERRFQMAGGIGERPMAVARFDEEVMAGLPEPPGAEVVLVRRVHSRLVQRAEGLMRERYRLAAEITLPGCQPLRAALGNVTRLAPLRHDYALVLAEEDPAGGAMRLASRLLFPAGSEVPADGPLAASVWVTGPPLPQKPVALPVVARAGDAPEDWRPLHTARLELRPNTPVEVRVALDDPCRVRLDAPAGAREDPRGWEELRRVRLPHIKKRSPDPVDLVCAMELDDHLAKVDARRRLLREVVGLVEPAVPRPGTLQVAAIGYHSHRFHGSLPEDARGVQPVEHTPIGPPADALAALDGWQPRDRGDDFATGVEDALDVASRLDWRPGSQRVLLIAGQRPPHPPSTTNQAVHPCPWRHDWEELLGQIRAQGARIVVVLSLHAPAAQRAGAHWDRIRSVLFTGDEVTVETVAREVLNIADHPDFPFAVGTPPLPAEALDE